MTSGEIYFQKNLDVNGTRITQIKQINTDLKNKNKLSV